MTLNSKTYVHATDEHPPERANPVAPAQQSPRALPQQVRFSGASTMVPVLAEAACGRSVNDPGLRPSRASSARGEAGRRRRP